MTRLDASPQVKELARDLGLPWRVSPMAEIRRHARAVVRGCLERFPGISSLDGLRRALCQELSVCVEIVREDQDLDRIADEYGLSEAEHRRLVREFDRDKVEGWLIGHPRWRPGLMEYVAIVDGRGEREPRAYFTMWHELTHRIVTPRQLAFEGFRRSIPVDKRKDPVESVVDAVAGELAFYDPFVRPVVEEGVKKVGRLAVEVIENMREQVAPEASFYSAAIACVRLSPHPALLVQLRLAYKKSERRILASVQRGLDLGPSSPRVDPKLRVVAVIRGGMETGLAIFPNMRVPERSVLSRVFESQGEVTSAADEDQSWWETSEGGPLPARAIRVEATRRGRFVYGLISPM